MGAADMVVKMCLALPLLMEDEESLFKGVCMEFVPGTPGLRTDTGNNPADLVNKVPAVIREHMTSRGNEQHTIVFGVWQEKGAGFSRNSRRFRRE
jgi:hypothetical protein